MFHLQDYTELRATVDRQANVVHRDQLREAGVSRSRVAAQLAANRWTAMGDNVLLLQNAPPVRRQLMWLAVLDAGEGSALGSHTSLELAGFKPFASEAAAIHLVVRRGRRVTRLPDVQVHESRRLQPDHITSTAGLPRTGTARSVIDAAAWQPFPRFACLMLAAAVQQRVTSLDRLEQALEQVGRVRHKAYMRLTIQDLAGGCESLGEIDLNRVCDRFGLVRPGRQVVRRDRDGRRRYLDAEWLLANGEIVVLEVDGSHHLEVVHWAADMKRERAIVVSRRRVLRATAVEMRLEPQPVVTDLRALGVPTLAELSAAPHARAS